MAEHMDATQLHSAIKSQLATWVEQDLLPFDAWGDDAEELLTKFCSAYVGGAEKDNPPVGEADRLPLVERDPAAAYSAGYRDAYPQIRINGYLILAMAPTMRKFRKGEAVILARRDQPDVEYVTAYLDMREDKLPSEWYWGNYFNGEGRLLEAFSDWMDRANLRPLGSGRE